MSRSLPLVYSCSGCSSAAQMANQLAWRLDRAGEAEMSCISGVGGGVAGLVRTARSGRGGLRVEGKTPTNGGSSPMGVRGVALNYGIMDTGEDCDST